MQHAERFGKQILMQESARGQSGRRKLALLFAIFMFGIVFNFLLVAMIIEVVTGAYEFEFEYVIEVIGGGLVAIACSAMAVFLIRSLMRYSKKTRAIIYERGLVHVIGREVTEIGFRDIKGIQDILLVEETEIGEIGARIFTIVKKDNTTLVLNQYEVPAYEEFFGALRQAFNAYLLEGFSCGTLHRLHAWLGEKLELCGERLIYHHPGEGRGWTDILLDSVCAISPFTGRSDSFLQIIGSSSHANVSEVLVEIPVRELFNLDVLYLAINDFRQV